MTCNELLDLEFPSVNGAGAEQRGGSGNGSLWAGFKSVVELKVKPRLQWVRSFSSQILLRKAAAEKPNPGVELSPEEL